MAQMMLRGEGLEVGEVRGEGVEISQQLVGCLN
jgi:hypothetical protein